MDVKTTLDSLLDIDSNDDDETITTIQNDQTSSLFDQSSISLRSILTENDSNNEQQHTSETTTWLGTDDGVFEHSFLFFFAS